MHSKYSRTCSKDSDLEHLARWVRRKGVTVMGTGDFTHPAWFSRLREDLVPAEPGLFRLRTELDGEAARGLPPGVASAEVRFMLSVEVSTVYRRGGRTRKIHHLVYLPGFDTIEECYGDLADHIFALETGLSSDPAMNWRVSGLDHYRMVSYSDAHSPPRIGRETTVFDVDLDYFAVLRALRTGAGHEGTVEFFPEEGRYHLDGHRKCGVRVAPEQTREHGGICPACGRPLTVGVLSRVEELADREEAVRPDGAAGFRNLVPLPEIVGEILGVGPQSKKVLAEVDGLIAALGPELAILEEVPVGDIAPLSPPLAEAVDRLRRGEVIREPGYDGEYGTIRLFGPGEPDQAGTVTTPALF